jgi:hypothetical protein
MAMRCGKGNSALDRRLDLAHQALDKAVDKCCRSQPFTSDAKRVEYLFEKYGEVV